MPLTPLWAKRLWTSWLTKFPLIFFAKTVYFLTTRWQKRTLNYSTFGLESVKSSNGVVRRSFLRRVLTGMLAKMWHAHINAKWVKDSSTPACTIRKFLMRHRDWKVLSKIEFISRCFGAARVNLKRFVRQYFWKLSDVKTEPKSDCILTVISISVTFLCVVVVCKYIVGHL